MEGSKGPVPLSKVISELVARKGWAEEQSDRVLREAWMAVTEARIHSQTRIGPLRHRILTIFVSNSPLLSELASFHKNTLLNNLKVQLPQTTIKDLKFRLDGTLGQRSGPKSSETDPSKNPGK